MASSSLRWLQCLNQLSLLIVCSHRVTQQMIMAFRRTRTFSQSCRSFLGPSSQGEPRLVADCKPHWKSWQGLDNVRLYYSPEANLVSAIGQPGRQCFSSSTARLVGESRNSSLQNNDENCCFEASAKDDPVCSSDTTSCPCLAWSLGDEVPNVKPIEKTDVNRCHSTLMRNLQYNLFRLVVMI